MARTRIRNLSVDAALTLPFPYLGVLGPGQSGVCADDYATVKGNFVNDNDRVKLEVAGNAEAVTINKQAGVDTAADLASNAAGKGASLVGIQDAGGLITGTTVEAALAELAKYETIALADPGTGVAIPVTRSAYVGLVIGAGAETNTLAIPTFSGQKLILSADTIGAGSRAVTAAQAINQAGNTVMTFAQARDTIKLEAITVGGALRWQVMSNDGVALT